MPFWGDHLVIRLANIYWVLVCTPAVLGSKDKRSSAESHCSGSDFLSSKHVRAYLMLRSAVKKLKQGMWREAGVGDFSWGPGGGVAGEAGGP